MQLIDCFSPLISFALYSREQMETDGLDSSEQVYDRFLSFVEQSRQCCSKNGYSRAQQENGLFAVIAWIDEYRLCAAEQSGGRWLHYELQRSLFNTSSAGDEFYDRLDAAEPDDSELRDVFVYCLAMGFRGRMFDDPEAFDAFCQERLGISADNLGGSLPEILFAGGYPANDTGRKGSRRRFLPSTFSLFVFLISLGVLGGLYLLCRQSLLGLYSTLPAIGL